MLVTQAVSTAWGFLATHKLLLFLSFLTYNLYYRLHRYRYSPLRQQKIPGPFLAGFTTWYRAFYVLVHRNWHRKLQELHATYGPIVWIAPKEVSVSDPKLRGVMYAFADDRKEQSFFKKGEVFETGLFNEDFNFLFETDPVKARRGKYSLTHPYSEQGLRKHEAEFDGAVEDLVHGLTEHYAKPGKLCHFGTWANYYFYDLCSRLAFGYSAGLCRTGEDPEHQSYNIRAMFNIVGALVPVPFAVRRTTRFVRYTILRYWLERFYAGSMKFGEKHGIEKEDRIRQLSEKNPEHLIRKYVDAEHKNRPWFARGNFGSAITNNIFFLYAGSTVASNNLPAVISLVYSHPRVLEKIRAELATLPNPGRITMEDLERKDGKPCRVPYTEAAILEGFRVVPTFGQTLPRVVPPVGCQLNEYFIPPGYEVGMSGWTVNYDKGYFGEDADQYRPERWLGEHPTELAKDGSGNRTRRNHIEAGWFTFGAGARVCVGRWLTTVAFAKCIAGLDANLEVEVVRKPQEWYSLVVHSEDMMVKFKPKVKA